jgi:CheY-like chemotaxis protein
VGLLRETMPSTIKISSTIEKDTQPVLANSSQVHEIIMNLATNAQHAMDEKGSLTINLYEKLIDKTSPGVLGPLPSGLYSVIEVQDSGAGISNEKISEIFDPFYTTKEVGKGTGLGLSVVFGLMQSWNGNIKVISKVGKGTTFKLFFPKTKQMNEEKELKQSSSKPTNRNEKILFVDDDETIVKMGEKILLSLGYKVFSTTKSNEALKLLKENINDFDLLISDQTMPEMTGIELAQEVLKDNPEFPILLCTGYSSKLDDATAKELGCKGFVHKPLTISELSEKIQEVLL